MSILSQRVESIKPSPTLAIDAKAKRLIGLGKDIINFAPGEPDFDTPAHIKQAAIEAINAGFTKYMPVAGSPDLKDAIINKFQRDNNLSYGPENIIVSCGGKHSLFNLFSAILNDGDEVIIPCPFWVSYSDIVILMGAKPVFVKPSSSSLKVSADDIKKFITKKTKAIIINSPSNPTGAVYAASELKAIADLCLENKILMVSDEIYEKLVYGDIKFCSIAQTSKEAKDSTVIINGLSKAYAMTGWRIGYLAGNAEIVSAMAKIQSQSTSNPCSISMKAGVAALNGTQAPVEAMRVEFEKRRDLILECLMSECGISCTKPDGAFYVFVDVRNIVGLKFSHHVLETDYALCEFLLDEANIAAVPGGAFGYDGYIRLSYACSEKNIMEGVKRIGFALKKLG
jgi:aspartate aminotransferase